MSDKPLNKADVDCWCDMQVTGFLLAPRPKCKGGGSKSGSLVAVPPSLIGFSPKTKWFFLVGNHGFWKANILYLKICTEKSTPEKQPPEFEYQFISHRRTGHGLIPISGRPRRWRSWWRRPMKKALFTIHWHVRYMIYWYTWHIMTIEYWYFFEHTIYILKFQSSSTQVTMLYTDLVDFWPQENPATRDQRQDAFRKKPLPNTP